MGSARNVPGPCAHSIGIVATTNQHGDRPLPTTASSPVPSQLLKLWDQQCFGSIQLLGHPDSRLLENVDFSTKPVPLLSIVFAYTTDVVLGIAHEQTSWELGVGRFPKFSPQPILYEEWTSLHTPMADAGMGAGR